MKTLSTFCLFALLTVTCPAQQTATGTEPSPDPSVLLTSIAQSYRLGEQGQHPWYLKATYQHYDANGIQFEDQIYEYWWAAPGKYRVSWSSQIVSTSVWVNGDSQAVFTGSNPWYLFIPEGLIGIVLVHPVPTPEEIEKFALSSAPSPSNVTPLRCVKISPKPSPDYEGYGIAKTPFFSELCMDPAKPILRAMTAADGVTVTYKDPFLFHGQYLARKISLSDAHGRVWKVTIAKATDIEANDLSLIPPAKAQPLEVSMSVPSPRAIPIHISLTDGFIEKRLVISEKLLSETMTNYVQPGLPAGLDPKKYAHSKVAFRIMIDSAGKVSFAQAISGPPELERSALEALTRFEFRPPHATYLQPTEFEPMEVESQVTFEF
jgi:hypothetical protein